MDDAAPTPKANVSSRNTRGTARWIRAFGRCVFGVALGLTSGRIADAQPRSEDRRSASSPTFAQAAPEDQGIRIPDGEPKPGGDRRVMTLDGDAPVVAEVHVEIGDSFIVQLPDGRLTTVKKSAAPLTDRPFEPATKEAMIEELKQKFPGFKIRDTRRYLYVYNASDAFRKATSSILETMYPSLYAYVERHDIPVHDPRTPLVVVIFETEDAFQRYHRVPEGIAAYYSGVSNYVVMYEQSSLNRVAPELAAKQSVSVIAHEGVHQILQNIGVQKRLSRWPMWISEGLPEYFAPTDVGRRIRWKGVGFTNDLRMRNLVDYVKENGNSPRALGLQETLNASRLDAIGYAKSWALVHYLAKRQRKQFVACLQEVSELEPLAAPPSGGALFRKHFGEDVARHEDAMFEHLSTIDYVDPVANQTHYVVMFESAISRRCFLSASPEDVKRLRNGAAGQRVQVRSFANKAAAEKFAQGWLNQ